MGRLSDEFVDLMNQIRDNKKPDYGPVAQSLNALESRLGALLRTGSAALSPDAFLGQQFSVLPHECASMRRETNLSIPNGVFTDLTYSSAPTSSGVPYSYGFGMSFSASNGTIQMNPCPSNSIFMVSGYVQWVWNSSGTRAIVLKDVVADTTDPLAEVTAYAVSGVQPTGPAVTFCKVKMTPYRNAQFRLQAVQDSGGALNINDAVFQVTRLR